MFGSQEIPHNSEVEKVSFKWVIIMIKRCLITTFILLCMWHGTAEAAPSEDTIAAVMNVEVSSALSRNKVPVPYARLIIIDQNGQIIVNRLTNNLGKLRVQVTLPIDQRFPNVRMGLATVVAVADGFNEYIAFDVPINEHGDGAGRAVIMLRPVLPDARNEPSYNRTEIHRFTIFHMLDYYAEQTGLIKQKQIQGAKGFGLVDMPWSSTIK